jgi:superfamily II DNA or RNA helicase
MLFSEKKMKVSTTQPFQLVYSLYQHEYLGYIFESYVVQVDHKGQLTLKHQNISSKNAKEFSEGLIESDYQLIRWMDAMQQEVIMRKFYNKKISIPDFFLKIYDSKKGDKDIQDAIEQYLDNLKSKILTLLTDQMLFIMGSDGNPSWKRIYRMPEKATVLFHFRRNEENTHYFPTIKYRGDKLEFQYQNSLIICDEPAWMIVQDKLYSFEKNVDGKKLKPFLNKKFIVIPKNVEETYYQKFVASLVASFDVHAKGFEIRTEAYQPVPVLTFSEYWATKPALTLFGDGQEAEEEEAPASDESKILFDLTFQYGNYSFKTDHATAANVSLEKTEDDSYIFHKIRRMHTREKEKLDVLLQTGLEIKNGRSMLSKVDAFSWLHQYSPRMKEAGFIIHQQVTNGKKYFLGTSSINVEITENRDWFDIYATVRFGEFEIPFIKLRSLILQKKREFTLPNGETAVIPEVWCTQYSELFFFSENREGIDNLTLRKHHLSLVQDLNKDNLAEITMSNKLEQLRNFDKIEDFAMPAGFVGELRPYQKAGYNWMQFLNKYKFGGCLADDMGLGKTVQTLTLLQAQKEAGVTQASLLVMPTSLIYNWEVEARKFTPDLRIFIYTGTHREKNTEQFEGYDLVLTSYGIIRIDAEMLQKYVFNYIILDESQAIKNPSSNIAKAVKQLNSQSRLILTGTPLENSTLDLWSQMSFVNPGLLGTEKFFRNEFLVPIEKKNDEQKIQRLYAIIKPFLLRRHKSQVATELPDKIENIQYCKMVAEQETAYEEAKSYFRNKILEDIDEKGLGSSQMILLQGLTKLRQIANHPKMVDPDYEGASGKLEDMMHRLATAVSENHKILIFSQFVKHLAIVRNCLADMKVPYTYLDGSTKDRQSQVNLFQQSEDIQVFLISLKAGGLGLNLTAADYVFILDPWWNPAIEAQAVDRAHRIGQQQTVFTYKFITRNTVEEKILALQRNKKRLADELITTEESFVKSLSKEDIMSLLD